MASVIQVGLNKRLTIVNLLYSLVAFWVLTLKGIFIIIREFGSTFPLVFLESTVRVERKEK